jgi:RimJ/RimL family protein N-acetyltransferase
MFAPIYPSYLNALEIDRKEMLELRPFTEEDCDRLIGWIPDARFLLLWAGPGYTWPLDGKQLLATLRRTRGYMPVYFMFKAVDSDSCRIVGHIELQRYERRAGHIGRVLVGDAGCRGKGYGTQLVSLVAGFAFAELGFDLLTLNVYAFNTPAVECYRRLGFRQVELRENARQFGDESWNLLTMELRREDWEKADTDQGQG